MIIRTALLVSTALAAMTVPSIAGAAQDPAAPVDPAAAAGQDPASTAPDAATAAPDTTDSGDQVVVVTAQKRTQVLIDVPQSITVVSGETLENQQASSFQDYLKLVPGLQLDQSEPGQGRLILRGLNTGGVASTVAVYMDETPFGSSTGLVNGGVLAGDFDTFDVARIEVLRGPQGTLYGANSLGGLLKFVTNAPDTKRYVARGRVSIEDTDGGNMSYRGHAVINIPLSDTIAFRASGTYRKEGGFIDSIGTSAPDGVGFVQTADVAKNINDSKSYGGRASLLFKPTDALDVRLSAVAQNIRVGAPSYVESDPNTLKTLYGRPTQSQFVPEFSKVNYRVYNGLVNYDLGFGTITSSTSYSTQKQTFRNDVTFNLSGALTLIFGAPPNELFLAQDTDSKKFSQEVRLASNGGDVLEWLVGGYYTHEKGRIGQDVITVIPGTLTPITDNGPIIGGSPGETSLNSKYKEYAAFANATLHLGEHFDVDFGGRYSHNKQKAAQSSSGVLAGGTTLLSNLDSSDNIFTYSVAPKYKINDHASVYARVAKGYRPGGPNVIAPPPPVLPPTFGPDTTVSYEIGFKGETSDRRASLDVAVYHIDWTDIQLFTTINNLGVNINGGKAKVDGAEFNATWRPVAGLNMSINGAYTNAKLRDDLPLVLGQAPALRSDRLPFSPKLSLGLNADYSWSLGGETAAFVGGSLRTLSKQNGDYDAAFRALNGRQRKVPGYEVVDIRGGIDFGRFSVEAYSRNLFNSHGKTSTVGPGGSSGLPQFPNGAIATGIIRPRTIGLSLTAGL
jgi:outer membrane receptor protein involved in Fe transport